MPLMRHTLAALSLVLASCTLETEGATQIFKGTHAARVECNDGNSGKLPAGGVVTEVEGWSCRASKQGERLSANCWLGDASFELFCDPATPTSAVQVGDCVVQVWCAL